MKTLWRLSMLLVLVPYCLSAQDLGLTVDDVTEHMQETFARITTVRASFVQTVKFGFTNIEQTFEGTLAMRKPKKYRIESEHQTIVTDGKTVWLYSPVNRVIQANRSGSGTTDHPLSILGLPLFSLCMASTGMAASTATRGLPQPGRGTSC